MADKARLRCAPLNILLILPWWPTDVSRTLAVRTVSDLERPDRTPLSVPSALTLDDYTIGYTLRQVDHREPVSDHIDGLERLAKSKRPVQLLLADQSAGLFRIDSASVAVTNWTTGGKPAVADVSIVLIRASDAVVNVGLVKRVRGRVSNARRD